MAGQYKKGLVSIGLPVYNGAASHKLPRALDSLLTQTYPQLEIIVSDNASTDDTERVCREYAARDPRIRYFRRPHNLGLIPNTQFVIEQAKGEYFMLAADDDWWSPEFIAKPKEILDAHPTYGAALNSVRLVYPDGSTASEIVFAGNKDATQKSYGVVFDEMSHRSKLHWFAGIYRTKLLHDLLRQPFSPSVIRYDRVFMCELAMAAHIWCLPEIRYHKTTYQRRSNERYAADAIGAAHLDPKAHTKYILAIMRRLLCSRAIPLHRKMALYTPHFARLLWRWRRPIVQEWLPL